jgi:DNA-binding response OmpR family regulator/HPt (histidine-containing phosphotransfer) domain-containing protein
MLLPMNHERRRSDQTAGAAAAPPNVNAFLRGARHKFVVGFRGTCETLEQLLDRGENDPLAREHLQRQFHRLAELARSVGFPAVSARASALEALLAENQRAEALSEARTAFASIRDDYIIDLVSPPAWSRPSEPTDAPQTAVLVVSDDPGQRCIITDALFQAGYKPDSRDSAVGLLEYARSRQPAVIVLAVELPGIDGFGACQLLKSDPDTCAIPIVFMGSRPDVNERLAGLTLGADDYFSAPLDTRELLLRLQVLCSRQQGHDSARPDEPAQPLERDRFMVRARAQLARSSASVGIIALSPAHLDMACIAVRESTRRRDLVGRYDRSHLLLLLPDMQAADARDRLQQILDQLPPQMKAGMRAGVAFAPVGSEALDAAIARAEDGIALAAIRSETVAVAEPRARRTAESEQLTVVIADENPDVSRIVDAYLRSAGYRTVLAFDRENTLQAIETSRPAAIVLDVTLPKTTGLDVLRALQPIPNRPRVLALSANSREEDVLRALALGADDYLTKPFDPAELLTRLSRLVR